MNTPASEPHTTRTPIRGEGFVRNLVHHSALLALFLGALGLSPMVGTPRIVSAAGGSVLLVGNCGSASVQSYDATTGQPVASFNAPDPADQPCGLGLALGPDGNLYVANSSLGIVRYNSATATPLENTFIPFHAIPTATVFGPDQALYFSSACEASGVHRYTLAGATDPAPNQDPTGDLFANTGCTVNGLAIGKDGHLYTADTTTGVDQYDLASGAVLKNFIAKGTGGLINPVALDFGPDGNLYLENCTNGQGSVLQFDGITGAFMSVFVAAGSGGLKCPANYFGGQPGGLAFGPDGNLYVTDSDSNSVLRFCGPLCSQAVLHPGDPFPGSGQTGAGFIVGNGLSSPAALLFLSPSTGGIAGTVYHDTADPSNVVSNAVVQACPNPLNGGTCAATVSASDGAFNISNVAPGNYVLSAYPPGNYLPGSMTVTVTASTTAVATSVGASRARMLAANGAPFALLVSTPHLPDPSWATFLAVNNKVACGPRGGSGGVPVPPGHSALFAGAIMIPPTAPAPPPSCSFTLSFGTLPAGCSAMAPVSITFLDTGVTKPLMPGVPSSWTFSASWIEIFGTPGTPTGGPERSNPVGLATVTMGCAPLVGFDIYFDPAGMVETVDGTPIAGATVTLLRSDDGGRTFAPVPDGSPLMDLTNRANPDTTDAEGLFGWNVAAGLYRVRAAKAGCVSPTDSSKAFVETGPMTVPPPVVGLDVRLSCPPAPTLTITANNKSMTYGVPVPSFDASFSGFANGNNSSIVTGLVCSATDGSGNPVTSRTPAGVYTITCGGASAPGYTITYQPGTLTIGQRPLVLIADNQTMTYGAPLPALTFHGTFVNGDTAASALATQPTCSTTASSRSFSGTYPITCSGAAPNGNYTIDPVAGYVTGMLTVTPKPARVTLSPTNPFAIRVTGPGGTAPPLTFSAHVSVSPTDAYPGDIAAAAPVTFTLTPLGPGTTYTCAAPGSNGSITVSAGHATLDATCTVPAGIAVNVYRLTVAAGGNYAGQAKEVLVVFDPSLGGAAGAGVLVSPNGFPAWLAFEAQHPTTGGTVGGFLYVTCGDVACSPSKVSVLSSTGLKALATSSSGTAGRTATITGSAQLDGAPGFGVTLTVTDYDARRSFAGQDQVGLKVTDPSGTGLPGYDFGPVPFLAVMQIAAS